VLSDPPGQESQELFRQARRNSAERAHPTWAQAFSMFATRFIVTCTLLGMSAMLSLSVQPSNLCGIDILHYLGIIS
jgi:hypothetical protein